MRKLFLVTIIIAALCGVAAAQNDSSSNAHAKDIPNMGHAPAGPNAIGRLDARVFDEAGQPIPDAYLKLDSNRSDGFFCECWNSTDERGVAVLPPIHVGTLKLTIKAKGYETQKITLDPSALAEPVHITLKKSS